MLCQNRQRNFSARKGSYKRESFEPLLAAGFEVTEPALWSLFRESEMHKTTIFRISVSLFALPLLLGTSIWAQKLSDRPKQAAVRSLAYDATQETVLEGTVLSYSAKGAPPLGAHLILQTANGPVDLHLGGASYLLASQFSLAKGDSVRAVGVNSATRQGSIFLVRVIQKGGKSIVLRTAKGTPLSLAGARALGLLKTSQPDGPR
jgi:hypothetical protein